MTNKTDVITRYMLGEVSESERDWIETQMTTDEEFLECCMAIEDQLVDDYVLGHLEGSQRAAFEKKWLASPRIQAKLDLTRTLVQSARRVRQKGQLQSQRQFVWSPPARPGFWQRPAPWVRTALATGVAAVIFAGFWIVQSQREVSRLRAQLAAQLQTETMLQRQLAEQTGKQAEATRELAQERALYDEWQQQLRSPSVDSRTIASVVLLPGGLRNQYAQSKHVVVTAATKLLRLELMVEPGVNYQQYQIQLERSNGDPVLNMNDLHLIPQKSADGQFFVVSLQAGILTPSDYLLVLRGKDGSPEYGLIASYNFSVERKPR